jgi:penicillin-insensitive murein endopeptidase
MIGAAVGRQYVHDGVRAVILEAFAARADAAPGALHIVGETGWPGGGRFRPHRTHANGLSVDLFVPVLDGGRASVVPTWPWTKLGYSVDYDAQGRRGESRIDFEELAALLREIDTRAPAHGLRVEQVITHQSTCRSCSKRHRAGSSARSRPCCRGDRRG